MLCVVDDRGVTTQHPSGYFITGVDALHGSASGYNSVLLTGTNIDLRGKSFENVDYIEVVDDNAVVTVSSMSLALKLRAPNAQGESIVLDGVVSTPASRADLHAHGFDTIVDGANQFTDAAPVITGRDDQ
jgi:hypothetical protein